jgi:hypothetical protein
MRLPISAALLAAFIAAAATGIEAQSTAAVPVAVTFADGVGHKIGSDGSGPYQHGKGVSAVIDPSRNGELIFYSVKSGKIAQRQFRLTFDDCIGTCGDLPFVSDLTGAQIIAGIRKPDLTSLVGGMLKMPVDVSGYRAGLKVYIGSINSVEWTLCQTPADSPNPCTHSPNTGSTPTYIMRTAPDTWTIWADPGPRPDPYDPNEDLRGGGELFKGITSRRSKTITLQGEYAMPFSMTVQCVNAANCPAPAP